MNNSPVEKKIYFWNKKLFIFTTFIVGKISKIIINLIFDLIFENFFS